VSPAAWRSRCSGASADGAPHGRGAPDRRRRSWIRRLNQFQATWNPSREASFQAGFIKTWGAGEPVTWGDTGEPAVLQVAGLDALGAAISLLPARSSHPAA